MTTIIKLKINLKPRSFFNKVADTASTELLWAMISAEIFYRFLQIHGIISRKLYDLCEIIVFQKAALNSIFFRQKSLMVALVNWVRPFFYGTSFKVNPLFVHFKSSYSPSFIFNGGFSCFLVIDWNVRSVLILLG